MPFITWEDIVLALFLPNPIFEPIGQTYCILGINVMYHGWLIDMLLVSSR